MVDTYLDELLLEPIKKIWDEEILPSIPKVTSYALFGAAGWLSINELRKKFLGRWLDRKINDIYNPSHLTKHVWISGVQGSGKSNKLRRIFINSFVKQGWGGIYIDTHGTADLLLRSIPENRWDDVIYIAPWMKKVYGINVLQRYSNEQGEVDRIAEDVTQVFHKMYPRSWGDKLSNTIKFATKAVLFYAEDNPEFKPTLMDVYRVLTKEHFRKEIIKNIDNEIVEDFLSTLKNSNATQKLSNPLSSEDVLVFLCQQDGVNILEAMENRKIIICNFDKDKLSENANLMAGNMISIVSQCAAKRSEMQKHPYFGVAMDEFYEYANKHISVLISQMRKKNVCVLLANQFREQIKTKEVQDAVSMCQTKFVHTIADEDLGWMSRVYSAWFKKEELIRIPFYSCIHDVHNPFKKRNPKLTMVPPFIYDNDWEYAGRLKYHSLGNAPNRYMQMREINQMHNSISKVEDIDTSGVLIYE